MTASHLPSTSLVITGLMAIKSKFRREHLPTCKTTDVGLTCWVFFLKFYLGSPPSSLHWHVPNVTRLPEIIFHCCGFSLPPEASVPMDFMTCFSLAAIQAALAGCSMEQLAWFQVSGPELQPPQLHCRIPASTPSTLFSSRTASAANFPRHSETAQLKRAEIP